ncbi:MAG: hypothetical protein Q7S92_07205 [Candidatus Diapherotrites archaeon]|nr:hypothetical protein [Candidatus Diapherotrites archaeon]
MVMVGFTLSKINLLIFVTAMFVIIVYFTFGFSEVLLKQQTAQMINRYAGEALSLVNSKSLCVQNTITFPDSISYVGSQRIFYILKIEKVESLDETKPNSLIFTIFPRKEPNKVLASRRIDTLAEIHFFNQLLGSPAGFETDALFVLIDSQSVPPLDSLFIAKESFQGNEFIYLTNCSSTTTGGCFGNVRAVGNWIANSAAERSSVSLCVPYTASGSS